MPKISKADKRTPITKSLIKEHYVEKSRTCKEIADLFGYSSSYIHKKIKDFNIKTRPAARPFSLIGKRFGKLTVINGDSKKVECRCDCGKIKTFSRCNMRHKTKNPVTLSCGCLKSSLHGKSSPHWSGYEGLTGKFWSHYIVSARDRSIPFDITKEYAWDTLKKQDFKCALSNQKLTLPKSYVKTCKSYISEYDASLDRIDNDKGYVEGNIQWLHKHVNRMKLDHNMDYFLKLCSLCDSPSTYPKTEIQCCKRNDNRKFTGYKCISGSMWWCIKDDAKRREITFDLNIEDAWILFVRKNGFCALSGLPLVFSTISRERSKTTASLDRIDSSKGYVLDNIQWLHKDINVMKSDYNQHYFLELCSMITKSSNMRKHKT